MIVTEKTKKMHKSFLEKKRSVFIDVAKGIGILFVIIAHVNYTPSVLTVIYSFHMPLFFFLSGMVFDSHKYGNFGDFIKRKSQRLLCPYVLFYLLSILYRLGVTIVADLENFNLETYVSYLIQMFLSQGSAKLPNAPLWFVPCLFLVEIIYYWISKLKKPLICMIVTLLTALGWFLESGILPIKNEFLPWSLDSALFAIGFFSIGNLSFKSICIVSEKIKDSYLKKQICIAIVFFVIVLLIPLAFYNGKISMGSKILGNGIILYMTGILGTCAIILLSILFEKNRFLIYCGKNSFQIMAVHFLIRDFLRLVYKFFNIPIYDKTSIIETILPIIIVVCTSLMFSAIYNKIANFRKSCAMRKTQLN